MSIICPGCIARGDHIGDASNRMWETLTHTAYTSTQQSDGNRYQTVTVRGQCRSCECQIVVEQTAFQDAEGTWRITKVGQ